jgi:L-ascorbate metabolism protein UlaG (beta-lactamase superfamily)
MYDNITVFTHSAIRIAGEKVLYFDPFQMTEEPCDADILFVTHDHYDHWSPEDAARVIASQTVLVVPIHLLEGAKEAFPSHEVVGLESGDKVEVCGLAVEAVPAYNLGKDFHKREYGGLGYLVMMDGVGYYVSGDTDDTPEIEAISCDVALVPIGGTYTMTPSEAARAINMMRPRAVIPTHYGSIVGKKGDFDEFAPGVDEGIAVVKKLFL